MKIIILTAVIVAVLLALVLEILREQHFFRVTHYEIHPDGLAGMRQDIRIVFLSDLHNHVYGEKNDVLFRAVMREKPDLILIGGDMLVGKPKASPRPALEFVRKLPEICPVFYVNGNHEQRMKEFPEKYRSSYRKYRESLERYGVVFLENQCRQLFMRGRKLTIIGLELPLDSYKKFRKYPVDRNTVTDCLRGWRSRDIREKTGSDYQILLAHNPTYMHAYKEWGADLILSGHLHGGIVRLPLIGGVITPQGFLFPRYSGEMREENGQTVVVSRGLGTHTIRLRLFNMPEVVALTLKG
ncbi:hypothetical protein B5F07_06615 [Lachnoclostridium sp. An169]|uniref:metallophosphoesterase n=1 Tax=Lachnoclostridium sp. An169 TaxID=1965569 RepID=UPI000B56AB2D|nr:metallophosphoesterase [Lachnoclostridium sp. An169]OUP84914.1 hypothetical protein B5F07_06615 [Lachnoclostridium sp. An169]HJA66856.1 metallophosphoesterase [Candidatus Mediterraneibacter cottocaccae]